MKGDEKNMSFLWNYLDTAQLHSKNGSHITVALKVQEYFDHTKSWMALMISHMHSPNGQHC